MNSFQGNTIWSEIQSDAPISDSTLAYLEARAKNAFYDFIITKFKESERNGLNKTTLARRINKRPDQISHILGAPGNWTLGTITALLVGISREELLPRSEGFFSRPMRNIRPEDLLDGGSWASQKSAGTSDDIVIAEPVKWDAPR